MKDFYNNNDKVFREKITSHEFQFDSSAWDKMEKMLDDEDPRKSVAWRYPYMMMILGIFFLGVSFLSPTVISNEQVATTKKATSTMTDAAGNDSSVEIESAIANTEMADIIATTKQSIRDISKNIVETKTPKQNVITKAIIETPVYNHTNHTNSINTSQNIVPSIIKSTPVEAVKTYIEAILDAPAERENIQAFMEVNSLLSPVEYEETVASLPITMGPIVVEKKRVKVGVQAGASVVLAKRSIADQGKLATSIGGFINFDLDAKNSIAIEANYKNGFSEANVLARNSKSERNLDQDLQDLTFAENESYIRDHGYTEVNNVERVHTVEIPIIYKRKLGKRNSIIAGVKPSIMKFKNSSELTDPVFEASLDVNDGLVFDLGLVGGIEHQINRNFSVDLRYNQGLLDISSIDEVKNTNSELAFTMKYTF